MIYLRRVVSGYTCSCWCKSSLTISNPPAGSGDQGSKSAQQLETIEDSSPSDNPWPHEESDLSVFDKSASATGEANATSIEVECIGSRMFHETDAYSDRGEGASADVRTRSSVPKEPAGPNSQLTFSYAEDPGVATSLSSLRVSGFGSGQNTPQDISRDSFNRYVPGRRRRGHAPHGAPDFMVRLAR